ncbi:rhamnan synthesis F family protein [Salipiger mangrovisoli]|uniref:Glycosyltransferase n=1 Tax=Salipiger mangrovisoli TaxID=2865933 RepID=A0ABR9X9S7_9RHOB|nr:rhamnan synthesis F family protein [Salipiger mangrovisoli]MBE9640229.1 glycosyltransferase [Salipiger mangrovisoli]
MRRFRAALRIGRSPFFDRDWYARRYLPGQRLGSAARHYLVQGAAAGHDPGPEFSTRGYLAAHPDVAAAGMNPLLHYERYGRAEGREVLPPLGPVAAPGRGGDYAVIVHAYHPEVFDELNRALGAFPEGADIYVSYPRGSDSHDAAGIRAAFPRAVPVAVDNLGQDVGAFLQVLERIDRGRYRFYCKLHSKMGDKLPELWRGALLQGTVGSAARVAAFEAAFRDHPEVLLGGARELFLHGPSYLLDNEAQLAPLLRRAGVPVAALEESWGFFGGTFCWLRAELAARLMGCLRSEDFAPGEVRRDGQLAHAGERLTGLLAQAMGGQVALASCLEPEAPVEVLAGLPPEAPRRNIPMTELLGGLGTRWIAPAVAAMAAGQAPGLGAEQPARPEARAAAPVGDYAILTPTGDRPEAFAQCLRLVARQSVLPREWIVVDDGARPLTEDIALPDWARYLRRPRTAEDPPHTLPCNVLAGLEQLTAERVLIFEDDDWYSPLYAEFLLPWLDSFDLVGLNLIRYYHLRGQAWKHGFQPAHTAFAQSGFRRGPASEYLARVCRSENDEIRQQGLIDRHWWHGFEGRKYLIQDHPALHLGLKGGPGRPGLASGHDRAEVDYIPDPDGTYLAGVLGPDRVFYE